MNSIVEGVQYEFKGTSDRDKFKAAIEAMLFASGEPLNLRDIAINLEITPKNVEKLLSEMILEYEIKERGIKLISINGSYQLVTKAEYGDYVQKLLKKNKRQSLSQASLESLAIVAYKQPITRIDIDEIRGVKSESALQRLIEKDLIKEVGRMEVPGRPILFGTTEEFLRQFGLNDLKELPSLDIFGVDEKEIQESLQREENSKNNIEDINEEYETFSEEEINDKDN